MRAGISVRSLSRAIPRSTLGKFVAASLMGHLLFAALVIYLPSLRRRALASDLPMVVELAGPMPGSAGIPPSAGPPRTTSKAPVETPPKPASKAKARTKRLDPSPKAPRREPTKRPVPAPDAPDTTAGAETGPAEPAPPGTSAAGLPGGPGVTSIAMGDFPFAYYRDSLARLLYGGWRRPVLENQDQPYSVTVSFTILRDGSIREARIESSSGIPALDNSALRAVAEASRFPPLPPGWRPPVLHARFRFDLLPEEGR